MTCTGGKTSRLRSLLAFLVVSVALVSLILQVIDDGLPSTAILERFSPATLVLATLVLLPMYWIKAYYHTELIRSLDPQDFDRARVLSVYLQAQLVRYLPGKIWGIVYQSGRMAQRHPPATIITANLAQTLTTNLMALFLILAGAGGLLLHPACWLLLLPALLLPEWLHRSPRLWAFLAERMSRWLPRLGVLRAPAREGALRISGTLMLASEWLFYFGLFWILLGHHLALFEVLATAIWYAGASLLSMLAVVIPAGLTVREALFVASPAQATFTASELLLLAVILRLLSVVAEILTASIALIWQGFHSTESQ